VLRTGDHMRLSRIVDKDIGANELQTGYKHHVIITKTRESRKSGKKRTKKGRPSDVNRAVMKGLN